MPDPTEVGNIEAPVETPVIETPSEDPAIEELTRAFKLAPKQAEQATEVETVTAPEPSPEGIKTPESKDEETELDQKTASRLGRILSNQMKEKVDPLLEKISQLEEQLRLASMPKEPTPPATSETEINPDEPIYTKGEVLDLLGKQKESDPDLKEVREMRAQREYQGNYVASLRSMFKETSAQYDPDMQKEIAKVLDEELHNPKSHTDPSIAAERNFNKAANAVLLRLATGRSKDPVPGNGDVKPISATGLSTGTKVTQEKPSTVVLDAEAKKLAKSFNLSFDRVQQILAAKGK